MQTLQQIPTIVTGATSGIGHAMACQLAAAGTPVIALGRNRERLQVLAGQHPAIAPMAVDLSDLGAIPSVVADIVLRFPNVAALVNNAGIQHNFRLDDAAYGADDIRHELDVNLVSPMVLIHALLPHFLRQPNAWVVNVTSGLGYVPKRTSAVYSASKAGLHLFTQALRVQMQGSPVRVVEAVMPLVDTPMVQGRGRGKIPATQAAHAVVAGLMAERETIWVGKTRAMPLLLRLAPGLMARVMQSS